MVDAIVVCAMLFGHPSCQPMCDEQGVKEAIEDCQGPCRGAKVMEEHVEVDECRPTLGPNRTRLYAKPEEDL
jgi:hypothetical protein